jgi:hypothetical protein
MRRSFDDFVVCAIDQQIGNNAKIKCFPCFECFDCRSCEDAVRFGLAADCSANRVSSFEGIDNDSAANITGLEGVQPRWCSVGGRLSSQF